MRCDDVQDVLIDARRGGEADSRREALEHLSSCTSCRDAQYAVSVLQGARLERIPAPSPGARQRAISAATVASWSGRTGPQAAGASGAPRAGRPGFWTGAALGGAVAAALVLAFVTLDMSSPSPPSAAGAPEVTLALNETRDISISVDTAMALDDAEIHIELTGAIGLAGFEDQRELRWRTNLDAGSNQLTLPVVALGPRGGQLLVEVLHREKRRKFVVDVRGA